MRNLRPMKKCFAAIISAVFCGGFFLMSSSSGRAAQPEASPPYDYSKPKVLTGTLYAMGSDRQKVLYTFKRVAARDGDTIRVKRQFILPDGAVAAVENVIYNSGQLVSFEMQDYQANVSGRIQIRPDPRNPVRKKIFIGYGSGLNPPKGRGAPLLPDTLTDDTLYPFMLDHWDDLMRGRTVRFHFVSLDWERTFDFTLGKSGESDENGQPVVRLTMKPASMFVSAFVKPIVFTVQANGAHLILSYIGRTTPRVKKGNSWKELDAETVFHYPPADR